MDLRNATEAWVHADMEVWRVQELATHPSSVGDGSFQILVHPMGATNWATIWDDCRTRDRRDVVNAEIPKALLGGFADIGFRMDGTSPLVVRVDRVQVDDSPAPPFWETSQIVWNVPWPAGVASAPYYQDFGSGTLPPEMAVAELSARTWQPDPSAWCQIADTAGTGSGQYCLEMGTERGYYGSPTGNIAVFQIDMSALTHPILSFKVRNRGDRTNNEDDIRIEDAPDPNCFQILTATGSCLQDITIEVEYPTPGGQVALVYGPPGTCGIVVQAVDLATCCASNSLTL